MKRFLALYPGSVCKAVTSIAVAAERSSFGIVELSYTVAGAIDDVYWPPADTSARTDNLWKRTCFEAFIMPLPGEAYVELNLSPSSRWAAYRFSSHRTSLGDVGEVSHPRIVVQRKEGSFELKAQVDLRAVPDLPKGAVWRLGLTAVIEEAGGALSYWALAHPSGASDFHNSVGFTWELPPAEHPG